MANETNIERGKTLLKTLAQGQDVERAVVEPDGTVTISHGEATLQAVDVADVDLLLTFSDGTFVIIPNGALDAISDTPHTVIFDDSKDTLSNLFKMVGISNPAKAGSLRVVSENIDAAQPPVEEYATPSDEAPPETWAAPAPMAKLSQFTGKGPGLGGSGAGDGMGEVPATVEPMVTPQPPVYRSGTATQAPVSQPDFGDSGPPAVAVAMYTSSSFKVAPSGRTDLPSGAYDPALANDPSALVVRSSPANQATVEKLYGTTGNDVIDHNSSFSDAATTWSKSIHLSFSNFVTVETVTLTLNAVQIAKIPGFDLAGAGVTKVAGLANVWTVDLAQHADYKTNGIDVEVRYTVGNAASAVDFIADLSVEGTGQVSGGDIIPVELTSQMTLTWRNAVTTEDFTVLDAGNNQMMVLPAGGTGYEIYANDGNDTVHAGAGSDVVYGETGNDSLYGDAGDDILNGGAGSDALSGGVGSDTATYRDATAGITADFGISTNNAGDAAGDTYSSIEHLEGSAFDDILAGDAGINSFTGLAGNDALEGRGSADIIDGGDGNDTASYSSDTAGVTVSLLTNLGSDGDAAGDQLTSIENLSGGNGNDTLTGDAGDNVLTGNAGNDTLAGGAGADSLIGGTGTDTADYAQSTAPVVVALTAVSGVTQSGDAAGDTYDSIENIVGSTFGDHLVGSSVVNELRGGTGDDLLEGLGGADSLVGGAGTDTASYAHATTGTTASLTVSGGFTQGVVPVPSGDAAGDTYDSIENLEGSDFSDILIGNGNANTLSGGEGGDTLEGMAGGDVLNGGGGINTASYEHWEGAFSAGITASLTNPSSNTGDAASDTYRDIQNLKGSNFNDTLTGDSAANSLTGGAGDDQLEGMAEADVLSGGTGSDTAVYSQATTAVTASLMDAANDNSGVDASGDTYTSIENLTGSSHDDILVGMGGSNILTGGAGNDILEGMSGADRLIGDVGDHDVASYVRAGLLASGSDTTAIGLGVTATLTSVFNSGSQVSGSGDAAGDIYTGIEDLTGSSYNDILIGDSGANILTGGLGGDKLEGMGGADRLIGGADADVNNTASYAHAGAISGGTGVTVSLATPSTSNTGDAIGDTYENIRNLEGSVFDDNLQGDEHDNTLSGLSGDDVLEGMAGADRLEGGAGSNTASYTNAAAVSGSIGVTASLLTPLDPTGNTGDAAGDTYVQIQNLLGSVYDDTLIGDTDGNRLDGNDGNDLLIGGVDADQLVGGNDSQTGSGSTLAGGDTAGYSTSSNDVVASLTASFDYGPTIYQSGDAYGDTFSDIENLSGSNRNDTLIGNDGKNILSGDDGNDILEGMADADRLIGGDGSNTASYAHAGYTEPTQTTGVIASLTDQSVNTGDASGDYYENIQNLLGSDYNDTLIGNGDANTLTGGKGNDTLEGVGGADYLVGGAGSDYASYANASTGITASLTDPTHQNSIGTDAEGDTYDTIENLIGSAHRDILIGNNQANILLGGAEDDVLEGMAGADQLDGGTGNNTASYEHWVDTSGVGVVASLSNPSINTGDAAGDIYTNIQNLTGSYLNDTLTGKGDANILTGGVGNDILEGKERADQLLGGAGSDTASYASAAATNGSDAGVTVSLLTTVQNSALGIAMNGDAAYTDPTTHITTYDTFVEVENLTGSDHNDTLIGKNDANTMTGGAGDDTLEGMLGDDSLHGGDGTHDVASYAHAGLAGAESNTFAVGVGVIASLTSLFTSGAAVTSSGDAAGDTYSDIEDLTGSSYDDTLIGNAYANIITGGTGIDKLEGMGGADILIGGDTGDTNNTASYAHANAISGSTGVFASLLSPQDGHDNTGDAEDDTYTNIRHLEGSAFDDILQGDENANTLTGLSGDDILEGMGEADTLDGGAGNNTVSYEHSPHDTSGLQVGVTASLTNNTGAGADAQGDTFVVGTIRNLIGSGFDDQLTGNAESNKLDGLAGNDTLEGMAGADRLDGGDGNDTLIGGSGADQLIGGSETQTGSGISLTGGDTASYAGGSAVLASLTTDFDYGQTIIQTGDAYNDTFDGIENLTGSSSNDTLIGNSLNSVLGISGMNILNGGAGDDILEGMGDADLLIGGTGTDLNNTASYAHAGPTGVTASLKTISGVSITGDADGDAYQNISNLLGSNYNDTLIGNDDANILTGGLGNDTLEGLSGADSLVGGDGSDTASYVHATASGLLGVTASLNDHTQNSVGTDAAGDTYTLIENLLGSDFNDTLTGDAGANQLDGGAGDDILEGLGGADTLKGNSGTDTATYASASGYVKVSMLSDITGEGDGAGDTFDQVENLIGSIHADILIGDNASNRITGGSGNDILEGRDGADILDGDADIDTVSYEHSPVYAAGTGEGVTASLLAGTGIHADAEGDTFINVENLTGSVFNDTLTGDANANTLTGGAGDDAISGLGGVDTLYGGDGDDTLTDDLAGTAKIYGEAGDDTITFTGYDSGSNTADFFDGGAGSDTLVSQYAGAGQTIVNFFAGTISYPNGSGAITNIENFTASASNTAYVYANSVDNIITGGSTLNDYVDYRNATGGVTVDLTAGAVTGASGNDTLISIENIVGTQWNDTLKGNDSANIIQSGYGADVIDGGSNDNIADNNDTWYVNWGNPSTTASLMTAEQNSHMLNFEQNSNLGIIMTGDAAGHVVTNMENITSSNGDLLYGNELNNNIYGRGLLEGFRGNDFIRASNSATAYASYANAGNSYLAGESITSSAGVGVTANLTTTLFAYGAQVTSLGDAAGDTYQNINNLLGSAFDDILVGNANANTLKGGDGNDILEGLGSPTGSSDIFYGGAGSDTVSYAHAAPVSGNTGVIVNLYTNVSSMTGDATGDIFNEIENITGSMFDDTLTGDNFDNILTGGLGNDTLDGGTGNDTANYADATGTITVDLAAGTVTSAVTVAGNDTLVSIERVISGSGNDFIYGTAGNDILDGGLGDDTIDGRAGNNTVSYATATGEISVNLGTSGAQNTANAGNDTLVSIQNILGSTYNDTLIGDDNNNIIEGGGGNDTLTGGLGTDTASYAGAAAAVTVSLATVVAQNTGGSGSDTLNGFESLLGSVYNDILTGDTTANTLDGGAGNDLLAGGLGADSMIGGLGTDIADYTGSDAGITVTINSSGNTGGHAAGDSLTGIENLIGSAYNDTITGDAGSNIIEGGSDTGNASSGDDLNGGSGTDIVSYEHAAAGITVSLAAAGFQNTFGAGWDKLSAFESILGSAYIDTLTGNGSANTIEGGAGADILTGGGGSDTASYGGSDAGVQVTVNATTGNTGGHALGDSLTGFFNLLGSNHDDSLTGDNNNNTLDGGAGNDTLLGGIGADILTGGSGSDTASYTGAGSAVTVNLTVATGQNTGGAGTDTLSGIENVTGSSYNDILTGDANANTLVGGAGNDTMTGNDGNDTLDMRVGRDSASGGNGDDTFIIDAANSSTLPTYAEGNANTSWAYGGGDAVKLLSLGGTYSLSSLFTYTTTYDTNIIRNMEVLDISGDGAATNLSLNYIDVQSFADLTNNSQIWIKTDSGDNLTINTVAGESIVSSSGSAGITDYTVFNTSNVQIAQIHWQTA